ncbi:hypothetical protein [Thiomicrorhabdus xiamenensis]|uniref:Lipoprotein n=1 Tax=Thiomicrorhabdus xiamenensis TaxID=2739063 RepID=A0A7D4TET5_9GAMM|nr:hypothetical protein [Thiomicrorhabdus xiamenensis]QKI88228.1 hypothetical protein HQN79_00880 [Thiomicrorhabdus xiamenensis]
MPRSIPQTTPFLSGKSLFRFISIMAMSAAFLLSGCTVVHHPAKQSHVEYAPYYYSTQPVNYYYSYPNYSSYPPGYSKEYRHKHHPHEKKRTEAARKYQSKPYETKPIHSPKILIPSPPKVKKTQYQSNKQGKPFRSFSQKVKENKKQAQHSRRENYAQTPRIPVNRAPEVKKTDDSNDKYTKKPATDRNRSDKFKEKRFGYRSAP